MASGLLQLSGVSLAGPVNVLAGASLTGSGVVGGLTAAAGSTFLATVSGNSASKVISNAAVNLAGASLDIALGALPTINQVFTVLSSAAGITGAFAGLPNNSLLIRGGHIFRVNYSATTVTLTFVS